MIQIVSDHAWLIIIALLLLIGAIVRWFLTRQRSKAAGRPVNHRIGIPVLRSVGKQYNDRLLVAVRYDVKLSDQAERLQKHIWAGEGRGGKFGLRDCLDHYNDVRLIEHGPRTIAQGVPFSDIALLARSVEPIQPLVAGIEQSYRTDFGLMLAHANDLRVRAFSRSSAEAKGMDGEHLDIFFGTGLHIPPPSSRPSGELRVEYNNEQGELVVAPISTNTVPAAFHTGQYECVFNIGDGILPTNAYMPLETEEPAFVMTLRENDTPHLLHVKINDSLRTNRRRGSSNSPTCVPALDFSTARQINAACYKGAIKMAEFVNGETTDLLYDVSEACGKEAKLRWCPDWTPERLRVTDTDFIDASHNPTVPHFMIYGLLLPIPWEWGADAESVFLYFNKNGLLRGNATCRPSEAIGILSSQNIIHEMAGEVPEKRGFEYKQYMELKHGWELEFGASTEWRNNGRPVDAQNTAEPEVLEKYAVLRGANILGRTLSLVDSDLAEDSSYTPGEDYADRSPLTYHRFSSTDAAEKKRMIGGSIIEQYSLAWLDDVASVEHSGNGAPLLSGYAQWCERALTLDASDRLSNDQEFFNTGNGLMLREHFRDGRAMETKLEDGGRYRIGPLLVEFRKPPDH